MTANRSREAALAFMDYLAQKGLMARATVAARKAAVSKVLGILSDEEAEDVTDLDLDHLMTRFAHLQGKGYTSQSLATYKSRLRAALDDFKSYVDNPLAFKPSVQAREKKASQPRENSNTSRQRREVSQEPPTRVASAVGVTAAGPMAGTILPIPIRADVTVFVQGLPFDLSEAEAKKIAAVIQAMAMPIAS